MNAEQHRKKAKLVISMTAQLEYVIHQLEKLTPEEQIMMAAQIQGLLEDAEDI